MVAGRNVNVVAVDDSQATQGQSKSGSSGFGLAGGLTVLAGVDRANKGAGRQIGFCVTPQRKNALKYRIYTIFQGVRFVGGVDGTRTRDPRRDRPME